MNGKFNLGRVVLVTAVLAAVAGATVYFVWGSRAETQSFMTARVERGDVRHTVSATGTLQAVTTVQVGSQVSGTISALHADFNSSVKKGQLIAEIDPSTFQAQVASARASLEQSRAEVGDARARLLAAKAAVENERAGVSSAGANLSALKAQRDDALSLLKRQETLASRGVVSARELESAQTAYRAAEARYEQAAAQLEQARVGERSSVGAGIAQAQAQLQVAEARVRQAEAALHVTEVNLNHTRIYSPIDGIVVSRNVDAGQTVAASLQAPTIFTIANDLTEMQVIANIDQADIGVIDRENRVTFTVDAFEGRNFEGTIDQIRIGSLTVQNVVTYSVVIDVTNKDLKLMPGMTANLTFAVADRAGVLKVPNAALRFAPKGVTVAATGRSEGRVWVQGPDASPQPRIVGLGISDGVVTEIVAGDLREGELVIVGQQASSSGTTRSTGGGTGGTRLPGIGGSPR